MTQVQVELDVFSGRPNPTWALTGAEADDIVGRLQQVVRGQSSPGPLPTPGMGYRGFVLRARRDRWRVFGDQVEAGDRLYRDFGRPLERHLLDTTPLAVRHQLGSVLPS